MEDLDTTLGVASSPTLIPRASFLQPECQQEVPALRQWLNATRPEGRGYVFSIIKNNNTPRQSVFDDHAKAAELITAAITRNEDVFVALARFQEGSTGRKSEFAESFLSVWVDIDCGEGKHYKYQDEAIAATQSFCIQCGLPKPSLILNSGGGIHLYWCFDREVDVSQWQPISQDLQALCNSKGFRVDPAVMGDPARVMRVLGSVNYKLADNHRPVEMFHPQSGEINRHDFQSLYALIKAGLPKKLQFLSDLIYPPASKFHLPEKIIEGHRNSTLLGFAGQLRVKGVGQSDIEQQLFATNRTRCTPPLDDDEVLSIAKRYSLGDERKNNANTQAEDKEEDGISELNAKFAWDLNQMNLYNIDTGRYVQKDRFITQYANRLLDVGTPERPRPVQLGTAWLTNQRRRDATRVVMIPGKPESLPDGSVNSWRGFTCDPIPGDVGPFVSLLKRLIPDVTERRYVLSWLAYLVQNPAQKFNVALVVWSSQQGTGKSLLFEMVGNLFDERHFSVVGQEVFSDGFTDWQAHKVFVICDEVSSTDKRIIADRLKGWITASKNNINSKNEPKFSQPNLIKYVFLSNHPDAVYLSDKDRRHYVVEAISQRLSDEEIRVFVYWRQNGGYSALLDYLLKLNTKSFNPTAPAPNSNSKQAMVEDNKSDVERWLDSVLEELTEANKPLISAEGLSTRYSADTNNRCSSKTITGVLRKRGIQRIAKQARFQKGGKVRLYALNDVARFDAMTDKELGLEFQRQVLDRDV